MVHCVVTPLTHWISVEDRQKHLRNSIPSSLTPLLPFHPVESSRSTDFCVIPMFSGHFQWRFSTQKEDCFLFVCPWLFLPSLLTLFLQSEKGTKTAFPPPIFVQFRHMTVAIQHIQSRNTIFFLKFSSSKSFYRDSIFKSKQKRRISFICFCSWYIVSFPIIRPSQISSLRNFIVNAYPNSL